MMNRNQWESDHFPFMIVLVNSPMARLEIPGAKMETKNDEKFMWNPLLTTQWHNYDKKENPLRLISVKRQELSSLNNFLKNI